MVSTKDSSYNIPLNTQDMLSAYFYARSLDKKRVMQDSTIKIPIFMDEKIEMFKIKYLYIERIKTKFGSISCMVLQPIIERGRIFKEKDNTKIWISDDKNKILIKAETEIWGGSLNIELLEYYNLRHSIFFKKEL